MSSEEGKAGKGAKAASKRKAKAAVKAAAKEGIAAPDAAAGGAGETNKERHRRDMRVKRRLRAAQKDLAGTKEVHQGSVSDEVIIRFDHVTKTYKLYKNDQGRFLGLFNIKRGLLKEVDANDDLSFEIRKGEAVAFLGLNGAGKSTALKMITGVTYPTKGEVTVNGRVSALLELTAGFNKQLTGRENIHLRGQIQGMTEAEIAAIEPSVVEFADLGLYIDQPVKSYSSGMRSRLGFAFAVAVDPEVLVVDEALSVGDRSFRTKCIARIREIMLNENVTVLFVTHSPSTAQMFCNRGIVLEHGRMLFDGSIDDAVKFYEDKY